MFRTTFQVLFTPQNRRITYIFMLIEIMLVRFSLHSVLYRVGTHVSQRPEAPLNSRSFSFPNDAGANLFKYGTLNRTMDILNASLTRIFRARSSKSSAPMSPPTRLVARRCRRRPWALNYHSSYSSLRIWMQVLSLSLSKPRGTLKLTPSSLPLRTEILFFRSHCESGTRHQIHQ